MTAFVIRLVATAIACLLLGSCSTVSDATRSDAGIGSDVGSSDQLDDYLAEMEPLVRDLTKLEERYMSVIGENYSTDMKVYRTVSKMLPEYQLLISDASLVSVDDNEIMAVHEILLDALAQEAKGLTLVLSALDRQDYAQIAKANEALTEGQKLGRQYARDLEALKSQ